jgi:hypothetical protein
VARLTPDPRDVAEKTSIKQGNHIKSSITLRVRASSIVRFAVIRAEHGDRDSLDKIGHVFLRELRLPPRPRPAYESLRAPSGPRFSRSSSSASACLQQLVRAPASVPPPSRGAMMIARRLLRSNAPAQVKIIHIPCVLRS